MSAEIHKPTWHVHEDGRLCFYLGGSPVLDIVLTPEQALGIARDLIVSARHQMREPRGF
jgi:hypothetical protein